MLRLGWGVGGRGGMSLGLGRVSWWEGVVGWWLEGWIFDRADDFGGSEMSHFIYTITWTEGP